MSVYFLIYHIIIYSVHMAVKGQLAAVSPVFLPYRFQASTLVARLGDDHLSTDQLLSCKCLSQVVMPHILQGVTSILWSLYSTESFYFK